jgi:hypothetical protein
MQIGKPLRTVIIEPLEVRVPEPQCEPDSEPIVQPAPEPETESEEEPLTK